MWEKIRKSVLIVGFISAIIVLIMLVETGKFESPAGLFLVLVDLFYIFWFTAGNINNK